MLYAKRIGEGMGAIARNITKLFYVGLMRTMYNIRAENLEKPTPWNMDCTAGETTLVIDYDGRFRGCELRDPLGNVKDYNYDVQAIMNSDAMKNEIAAVGHGYKANCWCTHGCWIMSSITFNPGKMVSKVWKSYNETKKLYVPIKIDEKVLRALEEKYHLDIDKLSQIGITSEKAA
jgi:hypothetical protein